MTCKPVERHISVGVYEQRVVGVTVYHYGDSALYDFLPMPLVGEKTIV